jgi:hypothetical protein
MTAEPRHPQWIYRLPERLLKPLLYLGILTDQASWLEKRRSRNRDSES